jgi:hypothetical protein
MRGCVGRSTPPEPFLLSLDRDAGTGIRLAHFSTEDAMSGVAYYEVSVNGTLTVVEQGPFALPSLPNGLYTVSVTAIDRAGNRESSTRDLAVSDAPAFGGAFLPAMGIAGVASLTLLGAIIFRNLCGKKRGGRRS